MSRLAKVALSERGRRVLALVAIAGLAAVAMVASGCSAASTDAGLPPARDKAATPFVLVTTPAVRDLGIGATLIRTFQQTYPNFDIDATVVASPDPAAWARANGGDAVITGQSSTGAKLVADGYARSAMPVMSDRIVLVGPKDDPARAKNAPNLAAALQRISDAATSLSQPGGVPIRFVALAGDPIAKAAWASAGRHPSGSWYSATGATTAQELSAAVSSQAYALVEDAAYRAMTDGGAGLAVLRSGGDMPVQRYVVVPLSGSNDNAVTDTFGQWLAKGSGQDLIARWGVTGSSGPLFVPADSTAVLWPAKQ